MKKKKLIDKKAPRKGAAAKKSVRGFAGRIRAKGPSIGGGGGGAGGAIRPRP